MVCAIKGAKHPIEIDNSSIKVYDTCGGMHIKAVKINGCILLNEWFYANKQQCKQVLF